MKLSGLARIGNDPELRYLSNNMAVLQLSLAYNYGKEKNTQWVRASLFGKRAESLAPYLGKGQLIYAEISDVNVNQFTKKDGTQGVSLEGIVQDVGLTGSSDKADAPPKPVKQASKPNLAEIEDDLLDSVPF